MAKPSDMDEFLTSMPFKTRELHRQGLKHRDYVIGYHKYVRSYLETEIIDTRRTIKFSAGNKQSWAIMHVLDLMQALRIYDNFEMICLNMIDFNNNVKATTTVEPELPDITSSWYKKGVQAAKNVLTYGPQALQLMSQF